jgi:hypothetical protein
MAMNPLALVSLATTIFDKIFPDPVKAGEAKLELLKLQQSGELAAMLSQTEINKVEAGSSSVFVAGWRPFLGWVCGFAMAYQYLARPFLTAFLPELVFPGLDDNLWQLLLGMLGLGGLRTFEKTKSVAR